MDFENRNRTGPRTDQNSRGKNSARQAIRRFLHYAPPGVDAQKDLRRFLGQLALSACYTFFACLLPYLNALNGLYVRLPGTAGKILRPGAVMADCSDFINAAFLLPLILLCFMAAKIAVNYASYYLESKSIYLMKRLPNPMERHLRCVILPLTGAAAILVATLAALLIYFAIYMAATPDSALTPGQWQRLWSVILC